MNPLISVIIPVYNCEKYVAEAIESILAQTYPALEVIVVDDGSTDGTGEIVKSFPQVKYLFQDNAGTAAARNRGIRAAKGEYIAFLDADDLWLPEKLAQQISAYNVDPDLELVTGLVKQFFSPEMDANRKSKINLLTGPIPGYATIAILVKRDLFDKVGLFHEGDIVETISWFAKVMEYQLKIKVLPDLVVMRRIHGDNHGILHKQDKNKAIARILKLSLDRRRERSLK